jgi:hypothetical protein
LHKELVELDEKNIIRQNKSILLAKQAATARNGLKLQPKLAKKIK